MELALMGMNGFISLASAQTTLAFGALSIADWAVLLGYLVILLGSGIYLSLRKQQDREDYFLGGRSMPAWAVAISVVATATSAATFVGGPQVAYRTDLTYLVTNVGTIIAVLLVAWLFIPVFYRANVSTVYELLEQRIGRPSKQAASVAFMVGRIFASGARIFIAALPLAVIIAGSTRPSLDHIYMAIAALAIVGVGYTLMGGVRSVIWTDVIQFIVFVGAAGAAVYVLLNRIPMSSGEIINALQTAEEGNKLAWAKPGVATGKSNLIINLSQPFTLLTALTGWVIFGVAAYATDHDLTQRMLTCKSAARGSLSTLSTILFNIPVIFLFMSAGLLFYIFYVRPDLMGSAAPATAPATDEHVFVHFILHEMPTGLRGLMLAGVFAAGLSSLNSALNAMSSAFVNDVYRHAAPSKTEAHYVLIGRVMVVVWGVVLGGFAAFCVTWYHASGMDLISFALSVMTFAYAGLLAVFVTAIFTTRGSNTTIILGLLTGFVGILAFQKAVWQTLAKMIPVWHDALPGPVEWMTTNVAFPWQMVAATALSLVVCCLVPRPEPEEVEIDSRGKRPEPSPTKPGSSGSPLTDLETFGSDAGSQTNDDVPPLQPRQPKPLQPKPESDGGEQSQRFRRPI